MIPWEGNIERREWRQVMTDPSTIIDLKTKYLGLTPKNPLVASASPMCEEVGNIRRMEDAGELNSFTGPNIVRETDGSLAADINCFLVGVRGKSGWEFYYQRAATIKTRITQTTRTAADFGDLTMMEKLNLKLGKAAPHYENTANTVAVLNHSLSACERLNFPSHVG